MLYIVEYYNGRRFDDYALDTVGVFKTVRAAKKFAEDYYTQCHSRHENDSCVVLGGRGGATYKFRELWEYKGEWKKVEDA